MERVDEITAELYRADPEEFTALRDRRVAEAKEAGDQQSADRLKKLRKPVLAAWALNALRHTDPDLIDELFALGEEVRAAQRELRGADLRELGARRDELIAELVVRTGSLAKEAGRPLGQTTVEQVRQTLVAALSDPEAAQRLSEGTLVKPVEYSGFGMQELADWVVPQPPPKKPAQPAPGPEPGTESGAERGAEPAAADPDRMRAWEAEFDKARQERDSTAEQLDRARAALAAREREQREVEQRRTRLREELAEVDQAAREVEQAVREANTRFRDATRASELANGRVAEVTRRMPPS